jgi:hypothetical protein
MAAERVGSSTGGQGKAVPVEETAVQLCLPVAPAENPKDVMSSSSDRERARPPQLKRDDRRAGVQTVELEEASGEHRNGT